MQKFVVTVHIVKEYEVEVEAEPLETEDDGYNILDIALDKVREGDFDEENYRDKYVKYLLLEDDDFKMTFEDMHKWDLD